MKQSRERHATSGRWCAISRRVLLLAVLLFSEGACAFTVSQPQRLYQRTALAASTDDEISQQLERARQVLAKSKAKLEKKESTSNDTDDSDKLEATGDAVPTEIPFFATSVSMGLSKRERVIKSTNQETGLIVANGEKMAQLSENEEWEMRSLSEVFENEARDETSGSSALLAERDVAASIFNLRKQLQTADYKRIFDTRNRFIGEDT